MKSVSFIKLTRTYPNVATGLFLSLVWSTAMEDFAFHISEITNREMWSQVLEERRVFSEATAFKGPM